MVHKSWLSFYQQLKSWHVCQRGAAAMEYGIGAALLIGVAYSAIDGTNTEIRTTVTAQTNNLSTGESDVAVYDGGANNRHTCPPDGMGLRCDEEEVVIVRCTVETPCAQPADDIHAMPPEEIEAEEDPPLGPPQEGGG